MSGKTVTSRLIVSLIDGVTAPAAKAGQALKRLQASANFVAAPVIRSAQRLGGAVAGLQNSLHGPGGIMAAFAAVDQTHNFVKFTEHMNRVRAATMASASEMRALQDEIFKVSKQHGRVYDEVAEGALQLVKSGKDIHEVMGALDATVGAAVAIEKSVGHAAETLTDIVYGMGLRVTNQKEAMQVFSDVADVAVAASFKFNQSYDEMSRALAKGAPIARIAGLSLKDIATLAGTTADENFKGARAGAALASSIIRMTAPTKKARAELAAAGIGISKFTKRAKEAQLGGKLLADALSEDLGVEADALIPHFDAILKDPRFKDNATMLGKELQKAITAGLEMDANSPNIEKARDAVDTFLRASMSNVDVIGVYRELAAKGADKNTSLMKELFGLHHAPSQIALINAFRQGLFDRQSKLLGEQMEGAVKRHETANLEGLSGSLLKLTSAWKLFGAALFTTGGVAGNLTGAFNHIADALYSLSNASPAVLKFVGTAATALAASAALGIGFEVLKIAAAGLRLAFVALTSPIGLVVAGLAAIAYFKWDAIKAGWQDFSSGFSTGFWDNLKIPDSVGQSWGRLKHDIADISGSKLDLPSWRELGETLGGTVARGVNMLAAAFEYVCSGISKAIGLAKSAVVAFEAVGNIRLGGGANDIGRGLPKGFSGARASGGPVSGGNAYLVGERGPEMFVPSSSGGIVPNGKLGGGGTKVELSVVNHIHGTSDPAAAAAEVVRRVEAKINELFRGIQADAGLRWT